MKILHVFDQFLNQTMNWVHRLMNATDVQHHVSSLIYVQHAFEMEDVNVHITPLQKIMKTASTEWDVRLHHRLYQKMARSYHLSSLKRYIEENRIDIVHFHFATTAALMSEMLDWPIKTVVSFYGFDYRHALLSKPELKVSYQKIFEKVNLILVEGQSGHLALEDLGARPESIATLHLGIDLQKVGHDSRMKSVDDLKLLHAATFTPKKGQLASIKAFQRAKQNCPNMTLELVGEVGDSKYFDYCKKEMMQTEGIRIRPFVTHEKWYDFIKNYDILIQPSRVADSGDCEGGAPVSLIDAQAIGRPVISTFHCDIPEVVKHDVTGILVEEDDIFGLSQAIEKFYKMTNQEYALMSAEGRKHIEKSYDIVQSGSRLKQLYAKIVK